MLSNFCPAILTLLKKKKKIKNIKIPTGPWQIMDTLKQEEKAMRKSAGYSEPGRKNIV